VLTDREIQVLERRIKGENQEVIARALKISQAAVSKFESNLKRKILDAEQLLAVASELGVKTRKSVTGKKVVYRGAKK